MEEYNKRLYEVNEILKFLPKEQFTKIPFDIIKLIQENMAINYSWTIDKSKSLKEQNLHRDTIAILSYINMEYLLNKEQKEFIEQVHKRNELNYIEKQQKNYNSNNVFKERNNNILPQNTLVETKKTNKFKKMIDILKKVLHIR